MRLAGENDLHRAARRIEESARAVRVMEDQRGPLISGEAAGEANRQRVAIEQGTGGQGATRTDAVVRPEPAGAFADEREHVAPQRAPDVPDFLVGDVEHAIPELRIVVMLDPVGAEMLLEESLPSRSRSTVGACTPLVIEQLAAGRALCPARSAPTSPA
jgi:hypothetical protein